MTTPILVKLQEDLYEDLRWAAYDMHLPMSSIVRTALYVWLKSRGYLHVGSEKQTAPTTEK